MKGAETLSKIITDNLNEEFIVSLSGAFEVIVDDGNQKKRFTVALAFGIEIGVMVFQSVFPTSLISSMGLTLINLAFFMTVLSLLVTI